ncbi:MAG TPA: hypothetical protein VFI02_20940 [Armatimonadota bacterium]|nr:hypothetical protein [Armatimonadota bacterium]
MGLPGATKSKELLKFIFPSKGLNTTVPSLVLDKTYVTSVTGIRFARGEISSAGALGTKGLRPLTAMSGAFTQHRADGTILTFAAQTDLFLVYDPTNNTWVPSDPGYTGFTTNTGLDENIWSFTDVFGDVYMSNGVGSLVWTGDGGSSYTHLDQPPTNLPYSARYLATYAGRLILANVREEGVQHEERVRWSVAQSPRDFTSDGSAGANDLVDISGPITGVIVQAGRCFLHKRLGITVMIETGLSIPSFAFQTVVDGTGTVAGATLKNIQSFQFFLASDGVYAYDGASPPVLLSESINKTLLDEMNWAKVGNSFAIEYPDFHEYHLFVPIGTEQWPTKSYIFNYQDKTWSSRTFTIPITSAAMFQIAPVSDTWDGGLDNTWDAGSDSARDVWDAPAEVPHLVPFLGGHEGETFFFDEAASALGETVSMQTADWDLNKPGMLKTVDRIRLTVRQRNAGTINVKISVNGGATWNSPTPITIPAPVGDENSIVTLFVPVDRITGEFFRLFLSSVNRFSLVSWELETITREEVR